MGRKLRGAASRAKKRGDAIRDELVQETAKEVATRRITSKSNQELFRIDTTAVPVKLLTKSQEGKQKKFKGTSEKDQAQINALLEKHDASTLQQLALAGKERNRKRAKTQADPFDLWSSNNDNAVHKKDIHKKDTVSSPGIGSSLAGTAPDRCQVVAERAIPKKNVASVAVEVAQAGQSFNPDPLQHQDVIGEALSLELRRQEAQNYAKAPISQGMSDATKAILVGDDESSSDDDEEEEDSNNNVILPICKRKEKLTRAQRNRQKRIRAQEAALQERKRAKKLLHSVSEVKTIKKQLKRQESERQAAKELKAQLKQQDQRVLGKDVILHTSVKDPLRAPTLPVALSHELDGSLRTVKPKGSLVSDRMDSWVDRHMAIPKKWGDKKRVVQGKKRKVRNKDKAYLLDA